MQIKRERELSWIAVVVERLGKRLAHMSKWEIGILAECAYHLCVWENEEIYLRCDCFKRHK